MTQIKTLLNFFFSTSFISIFQLCSIDINLTLIQMKKQLCNEQITRIIERQNVITFKRKNEPKSSIKSQKQQQDEQTKSNPNEENSFHKSTKRNMPLPQINRERKRLALRASDAKPSTIPIYGDKQVRQRDNLMLKNANNNLANQNLKLKTKNMNLQKEVIRLQKMIQEDPQKSYGNRQARHGQSGSLKIAMKNLKKELQQAKRQNGKIKTSIKFTTISQLEIEREAILEETQRLREMLQQERNRCNFLKMSQQSTSQQQFKQLQDRNFALIRENNDLKSRLSKAGEERGSSKHQQLEKNISRQLLNARNTIKQKDKQLQFLKHQIKKSSSNNETSLRVIQTHLLNNSRNRQAKSQLANKAETKNSLKVAKQKRLMSKSAQKYRTQIVSHEKIGQCQGCKQLRQTNKQLQRKIQEMTAQLQKNKSVGHTVIDDFNKNPIKPPSPSQIQQTKKFLVHRFKAHHLTLEESTMHLLNIQSPAQLETEISISQLLEISMSEPFSVLSDRYLETFLHQLCFRESIGDIKIQQGQVFKRKTIKQNFVKLIGQYQLIPQPKQDEMFIQIAQLITNYQQHIHKALTDRRNTENTVPEKDFYDFFKEIELEVQYIDFMVSQIILESLDLDHLNIYNLFEIFYMPKEEEEIPQGLPQKQINKNQYKMIDSIVKEVDQQYEESKSFLDGKQMNVNQRQIEQAQQEEMEVQYEQQFQTTSP